MYLSVQMNYSNENKIWILILQIKPCYMGSLTYCEQIKYLDASKYMHSQTFLNAHLKLAVANIFKNTERRKFWTSDETNSQ